MNESFNEDEISPLLNSTNQSSGRFNFNYEAFNPRKKFFRYFSLIFICLLSFGTEFCYVLPGALENQFENDLKITTSQFSIFFSLYSWPSAFLCLFGGFLIDRVVGIRAGAVIFTSIVALGQYIFGFGAFINKIWLMGLGRFVVGLGGEAIFVAQKAYAVTWFPASEINLVFGLIASAALLVNIVKSLINK